MVRQLDLGPGDEAYRSTLWQVFVDVDDENFCYGLDNTAQYSVPGYWDADDPVHVAGSRFGTDEETVVRVKRTAAYIAEEGPITDFVVYPRRIFDDRAELQGDEIVIRMPVRSKCCVVVNGVRKERLYLAADTLTVEPDEAGPTTDVYDGSQTSAASGRILFFGAGVHDLVNAGTWQDKLFPVEDNATIYLARGAWVIGSFDLRPTLTAVSSGVRIYGPGNMSGEWITNAEVELLPTFDEQREHSMIFGFVLGVGGVDNEVRDISIWNQPFYCFATAEVNRMYDLFIICPWYAHADALKGFQDSANGYTWEIAYNAVWSGDDCVSFADFMGAGVCHDNLLSTAGSAVLLFSYQPEFNTNTLQECIDNYVITCNDYYLDLNETEGGEIIKLWTDSYESFPIARGHILIDGLYIDGDQCNAVLFSIGNREYPPFEEDLFLGRGANGTAVDVVIKNVYTEAVPVERSKFISKDWLNSPSDIHLSNIHFGDEKLKIANFADYIEFRDDAAAHSFQLYIGDRLVTTDVNVCNSALSYIGESDRVTSINPLDGSEESRQCARAYAEAFEELLEMHNWSFTTKKIQMTQINADADDTDDPAWPYRYEIPEGMAEALAVLPEEHEDDYVVGSAKQPQDFHIKKSSEDDELRIYSKWPDAWLRYTVYTTNLGECSRLFIAALTWLMASKLAGTIVRGDAGETIKNRCLATFGKYLAEAKLKDAKQRQVSAEVDPPWLAGRTVPRNPWNRSLVSE